MTANVVDSSTKKIAVGGVQAIHAMLSMVLYPPTKDRGGAKPPLPARRERGGGGGVTLHRLGFAARPPHPALRADLSPQAGRGETEPGDVSGSGHHQTTPGQARSRARCNCGQTRSPA